MRDKRRMASHRVVIVGGGFGGLNAARELGRDPRVSVTLVDRRNFHLFQPLLYQVATGALSPGDIAQPLRSILRRNRNTTVLLGEAVGIDVERREVSCPTAGRSPTTRSSSPPGARHSYFGRDDWAAHAPGLKSIDDALEIRRRILIAFEAAEREQNPDRRQEWMTFVVVGGGPTGVELAGALGEISNDTLRRDFRSIHPPDARIILVEALDRVLPALPAGPLGLGEAPARAARRRGPDRDPGRPRRRAERPGPGRRRRGGDPRADRALGRRRPGVELRPGRRGGHRAPRPTAPAGSSSGRTSAIAGPSRRSSRSATRPCSPGDGTGPVPGVAQGAIQPGQHVGEGDPAAPRRRAGRRRSATGTRATSPSSAGSRG